MHAFAVLPDELQRDFVTTAIKLIKITKIPIPMVPSGITMSM